MPSEESLLLAQASLFSPFNGIGVYLKDNLSGGFSGGF
jgi:hypothetical protein